ncbi:MAG: TolC family protein [Balneola sp.]
MTKLVFMKSKIALMCVLSIAGISTAYAQDTLRIEEAIQKGLEKNFAIQVARNQAEIARNNNTLGNAGFLPVVTADGTINKRVEDSETQYSTASIPDRNDKGAETTNYNYGIDATWTVFDGLTMFATQDRLSLEENIGNEQARLQIENLLAELINGYYQIVAQQKANRVLENAVEVSQERIRIAETKRDLGSGSDYDLLQARADFNEDRAALIRSGTILKQAKILVNQILSDSSFTDFDVESTIEMRDLMDLESLLNTSYDENTSLMIARLNERVANEEIKELRGDWFPQIAVNGGYGYNRTESSSGFADFSKTTGFNYGVTARINLFDGFNKSRKTQNAQLRLKNQQLQLEELKLSVSSELQQTYQQYEDALTLIELEEENLQYTKQTQEIALERFRLGTISSVELRETQLSLLNAENRLILAQIEAKTAETELLRLSGNLLRKDEKL